MTWEQVRGHQAQVEMLRRALSRGRLPHAMLFVGAEGIGKRLVARKLAQALFCQRHADVELQMCGECSGCRSFLAATHPDYFGIGCPPGKNYLTLDLFLGAKERRGQEGLCHDISLKPMAGDWKVAVIDDAQRMNDESANALLKTLEEPPAHSLLILLTSQADAILPTIRSRCQTLRFAELPQVDLLALLEELGWADEEQQQELPLVAELAEGSLETARQLLDADLRDLRHSLYRQLSSEPFNPLNVASLMIEGIDTLGGDSHQQRRHAGWLIRFCGEFYRQVLLLLVGGRQRGIDEAVTRYAQRFQSDPEAGIEALQPILERIIEAGQQVDANVTLPLCIETLCDDLARFSRAFSRRSPV